MPSFTIDGLDELVAKLEGLSYETRRKGGRTALRKAAQLVANAAKDGARRHDDPDTGRSIADNIVVRWDAKRFKRTGDLAFRVGVLKGAILPKDGESVDASVGAPTPHWRLIEFGTSKMRAQPFMRPALAEKIGRAVQQECRDRSRMPSSA
eukprot:TRINITY_DN50387_c0_g1_i5.p1 TRINITY_DN50387_c0_g1~~TRINITY_DN50387_c0_g1_i5.p1  ORF type:complete len:151 (-),score=16.54 TRINITY_DN50387_c0_g1_i5:11-463(-)